MDTWNARGAAGICAAEPGGKNAMMNVTTVRSPAAGAAGLVALAAALGLLGARRRRK